MVEKFAASYARRGYTWGPSIFSMAKRENSEINIGTGKESWTRSTTIFLLLIESQEDVTSYYYVEEFSNGLNVFANQALLIQQLKCDWK